MEEGDSGMAEVREDTEAVLVGVGGSCGCDEDCDGVDAARLVLLAGGEFSSSSMPPKPRVSAVLKNFSRRQ